MNWPNFFTLMRGIILTPLLLVCALSGWEWWVVAVGLLAFTTDGIDGYLARKLNQETAMGAWLDQFFDKVLVVVLLGALVYRGLSPYDTLVVWGCAVGLVSTVVFQAAFRVRYTRKVPTNRWEKAAAVFASLGLIVLLAPIDPWYGRAVLLFAALNFVGVALFRVTSRHP
jgi:phosphatidylglycerophosphate synthase